VYPIVRQASVDSGSEERLVIAEPLGSYSSYGWGAPPGGMLSEVGVLLRGRSPTVDLEMQSNASEDTGLRWARTQHR
jgi:hypothetical protein